MLSRPPHSLIRAPLRLLLRCLAPALLGLAASALPARADGPPPATLAPAPARAPSSGASAPDSVGAARGDAAAIRSAALAGLESAAGERVSHVPTGRLRALRKIAVAGAVGFAALAVWRDHVADERARDYDDALFPDSAARLRESVRDAERERNLLAAIAAAGIGVTLFTFVY